MSTLFRTHLQGRPTLTMATLLEPKNQLLPGMDKGGSDTGLETYSVVFPEVYAHQAHPVNGHIHPDGWVAIEAESLTQAVTLATQVFDREWKSVYIDITNKFFPVSTYYPLGEIGVIHSDGTLSIYAEGICICGHRGNNHGVGQCCMGFCSCTNYRTA